MRAQKFWRANDVMIARERTHRSSGMKRITRITRPRFARFDRFRLCKRPAHRRLCKIISSHPCADCK